MLHFVLLLVRNTLTIVVCPQPQPIIQRSLVYNSDFVVIDTLRFLCATAGADHLISNWALPYKMGKGVCSGHAKAVL
jgi:hypothetical protein